MSIEPPPGGETYDQWLQRADVDAVAAMCRFFMEDDPVHHTLRKIAAKLEGLGIAYAIAGGMALGAHHFVRATVDVDILVDAEGLKTIHENLASGCERNAIERFAQCADEHDVPKPLDGGCRLSVDAQPVGE